MFNFLFVSAAAVAQSKSYITLYNGQVSFGDPIDEWIEDLARISHHGWKGGAEAPPLPTVVPGMMKAVGGPEK